MPCNWIRSSLSCSQRSCYQERYLRVRWLEIEQLDARRLLAVAGHAVAGHAVTESFDNRVSNSTNLGGKAVGTEIGTLDLAEGEVLLISDPRVITVVQLNPLRVKFSVSPRLASELKQNQKVYLDMSDKQKRTTGTVELVSPVMDAKSGTVEVSVLLDNTNNRFRSGTRFFLGVGGSESPPTQDLTFAAGGQPN